MKNKIITFKASDDEKERWRLALEKDGRTLSEVCRAALDRLASRMDRKEAAK